MIRLTVTLSEERHQALKEAAARQRKSIGQLIGESLEFYGIKSSDQAVRLVAAARRRACLSEVEALSIAQEETDAARGQ